MALRTAAAELLCQLCHPPVQSGQVRRALSRAQAVGVAGPVQIGQGHEELHLVGQCGERLAGDCLVP